MDRKRCMLHGWVDDLVDENIRLETELKAVKSINRYLL